MITRGSKIQLVKKMGIFDNIGEICEVVNVTEDGVISFRFGGCHLGCMSYDEFEKYFINYDETNVKKESKRKWNDWKYDTFVYYTFEGGSYTVPVKYRSNGKTVELRTNWKNEKDLVNVNLKAKATCNKTDNFDFDFGLDIADRRMQIKLMQRDLEAMLDEI